MSHMTNKREQTCELSGSAGRKSPSRGVGLVRCLLILCIVLAFGMLWGCGGPSDGEVSQPKSADSLAQQRGDGPPAIPDPDRILKDADVSVDRAVEVEREDGVYVFDVYTYEFAPSANLADSTDYMAYQMLLRSAGLDITRLSSQGTDKEYGILWGEYLLGYLTVSYGEWKLYVPEKIGINSTPHGGGGEGATGGLTGGSFQNDSFNITVSPWETGGGQTGNGETVTCEACNGSGRCSGCGGDGLADSIYTGEYNAFVCGVCVEAGVCKVCDGLGVWIFD